MLCAEKLIADAIFSSFLLSDAKDFRKQRKKTPKAADNVPDLDALDSMDQDDGALRTKSNELVYGIDWRVIGFERAW